MQAADARAGELATQRRADADDARLAERVIAVARALLTTAGLAIVVIDPPAPSDYTPLTTALLFGYWAFGIVVLLALLRASSIRRYVPILLQATDVLFAAALTLFSQGPNSPLVTFLMYPLLSAAYRWGFLEVMVTAVVVDIVLALEAALVMSTSLRLGIAEGPFEVSRFALRAIYVAAVGAAVGYLAENEKRRRAEARNVSLVLARARESEKLGDTVQLILSSLQDIFNASEALLIVREQHTDRVWRWSTISSTGQRDNTVMRPVSLSDAERQDYLFDVSGAAWHAAKQWFQRSFSIVAVDEFGARTPADKIAIPAGFLAAHRCSRLIGISVQAGDEWDGRVLIVRPGFGGHREQIARFALRLVRQVTPAVNGVYRVRRLRMRAEAMERGRVARELHDGITQSLLGLEMELVVLHRRAAENLDVSDDLTRIHQIVRREIIGVRELMEGIRAGDVESGELLPHLGDMVDRFSRYTGIAARFVSDGTPVDLAPHVRRQVARVLHEALINIRRHSGARRVVVSTEANAAWWHLTIEDDGRGFPFAGRLSLEELDRTRQGPKTINERLRLIGGTLTIESKPTRGSRLEVSVPLRVVS